MYLWVNKGAGQHGPTLAKQARSQISSHHLNELLGKICIDLVRGVEPCWRPVDGTGECRCCPAALRDSAARPREIAFVDEEAG